MRCHSLLRRWVVVCKLLICVWLPCLGGECRNIWSTFHKIKLLLLHKGDYGFVPCKPQKQFNKWVILTRDEEEARGESNFSDKTIIFSSMINMLNAWDVVLWRSCFLQQQRNSGEEVQGQISIISYWYSPHVLRAYQTALSPLFRILSIPPSWRKGWSEGSIERRWVLVSF